MANIDLPDAFDDSSLEMNAGGTGFRVAQSLQTAIAAATSAAASAASAASAAAAAAAAAQSSANSALAEIARMPRHYARKPDTAHADSDEFDTGSVLHARWTLYRTDTLAGLTSAGDVNPLSNPAAGTVRVSQNPASAPSWLLLQPALGLPVGIRRRIASRPTNCQFSVRMKQIVPGAATTSDNSVGITIAGEAGGNPDDTQNYAQAAFITSALQTEIMRSHFRAAGSLLQMWDSVNFDGTPHDMEFVIRWNGGDCTIYMKSPTGLHALSHTSTGFIAAGAPMYIILHANSANTATSLVGGFAPIYAFDYIRQLDSNIVLPAG